MTKAVLFDFWGTLVENGVWSPIKQVRNILNVKMPFSEYVVRMEKAMMTDKFNSLREAFENVCKEFNVEATDKLLEDLIGIWNKSWMLAKPYDETIEVLKKLRENHQVILVSNTDCFSVSKVMQKFSLEELFDKVYLSCELKMIKTDKNFLQTVLADLNLRAEDCVLVGDSIQSDIIAAKRIGIKGILIDRRDTRDYSTKIKDLNEVEDQL